MPYPISAPLNQSARTNSVRRSAAIFPAVARERGEGRWGSGAADQTNKLASFHSITSSASTSKLRNSEPKCLGGLEVDDKIEFGCPGASFVAKRNRVLMSELGQSLRVKGPWLCENALARDRDGINLSQKCLLVREVCKADSILPGSRKILSARQRLPVRPRFQTYCCLAANDVQGQNRTHAAQQNPGKVMQCVQSACRFHRGAFQSRLAWSAAPRRRSPVPCASSPHRHRRLS